MAGLLMVAGIALLTVALDWVLLVITYLTLGWLTPATVGDVADRPVVFAAWIALVRLPMVLAYLLALFPRGWVGHLRRGSLPDSPQRPGWHKVRGWVADSLSSAAAAVIVFHYIADPGSAHFWGLVALTAAGPLLLPTVPRGLVWLVRRRP